jgi:CheY-like chemotaxis protein
MPIMDGLTCTRKIRELERKGDIIRHIPIIAVTANARMEQINTALEAGMVCCIEEAGHQMRAWLTSDRMMLCRSRFEYRT